MKTFGKMACYMYKYEWELSKWKSLENPYWIILQVAEWQQTS